MSDFERTGREIIVLTRDELSWLIQEIDREMQSLEILLDGKLTGVGRREVRASVVERSLQIQNVQTLPDQRTMAQQYTRVPSDELVSVFDSSTSVPVERYRSRQIPAVVETPETAVPVRVVTVPRQQVSTKLVSDKRSESGVS